MKKYISLLAILSYFVRSELAVLEHVGMTWVTEGTKLFKFTVNKCAISKKSLIKRVGDYETEGTLMNQVGHADSVELQNELFRIWVHDKMLVPCVANQEKRQADRRLSDERIFQVIYSEIRKDVKELCKDGDCSKEMLAEFKRANVEAERVFFLSSVLPIPDEDLVDENTDDHIAQPCTELSTNTFNFIEDVWMKIVTANTTINVYLHETCRMKQSDVEGKIEVLRQSLSEDECGKTAITVFNNWVSSEIITTCVDAQLLDGSQQLSADSIEKKIYALIHKEVLEYAIKSFRNGNFTSTVGSECVDDPYCDQPSLEEEALEWMTEQPLYKEYRAKIPKGVDDIADIVKQAFIDNYKNVDVEKVVSDYLGTAVEAALGKLWGLLGIQ